MMAESTAWEAYLPEGQRHEVQCYARVQEVVTSAQSTGADYIAALGPLRDDLLTLQSRVDWTHVRNSKIQIGSGVAAVGSGALFISAFFTAGVSLIPAAALAALSLGGSASNGFSDYMLSKHFSETMAKASSTMQQKKEVWAESLLNCAQEVAVALGHRLEAVATMSLEDLFSLVGFGDFSFDLGAERFEKDPSYMMFASLKAVGACGDDLLRLGGVAGKAAGAVGGALGVVVGGYDIYKGISGLTSGHPSSDKIGDLVVGINREIETVQHEKENLAQKNNQFQLDSARLKARATVNAELRQQWLALNRDYPLPEYLEEHVTANTETGDAQMVKINIAIAGKSGTGKSSLVRAILDHYGVDSSQVLISDDGDGTLDPELYKVNTPAGAMHLWDLPGIGTKQVPAETYLKKYGLKYFQVVGLVTDNRFCEGAEKVLEAARAAGVRFEVVRTKIDATVDARKRELERLLKRSPSDAEAVARVTERAQPELIIMQAREVLMAQTALTDPAHLHVVSAMEDESIATLCEALEGYVARGEQLVAESSERREQLESAAIRDATESLEQVTREERDRRFAEQRTQHQIRTRVLGAWDGGSIPGVMEGYAASHQQLDAWDEASPMPCCICLSEQRNAVISECGHQCGCIACLGRIMEGPEDDRKCPICRQFITGIIRVYQS